jgi:hypothetical protein
LEYFSYVRVLVNSNPDVNQIVHKGAVSTKLSFYFVFNTSILTIGQTFTDAVPLKSYFHSMIRGWGKSKWEKKEGKSMSRMKETQVGK